MTYSHENTHTHDNSGRGDARDGRSMMVGALSSVAAGLAAAALLLGGAWAQDDAAAETETPATLDEESAAQLAGDVGFMRDCLETLDARGAPSRVCMGLVARQCGSEPAAEEGEETTAGAQACEARENDVWQSLLDETGAASEAGMSNSDREVFAAAQDAWALFRDAECAYEATLFDGEVLAEAERASCISRLTAERTLALRARQADVAERLGGR